MTPTSRRAAFVCVFLAVGCGPAGATSPPRGTAVVGGEPAGSPSPRPTSIETELQTPDGRAAAMIWAWADVGGRRVRVLLDTGASFPVLASWLAAEVGVEGTTSDAQSTDTSGESMEIRVARDVGVALEGWGEVTLSRAAILDLGPMFQEANIGLLVGPQFLAEEDRFVMLDLPSATMTMVSADRLTADGADPDAIALAPAPLEACSSTDAELASVHFVLDARVASLPIRLELDTGARLSAVGASSAPGEALFGDSEDAGSRHGAAGVAVASRSAEATLEVGGLRRTQSIRIQPRPPAEDTDACAFEGLLGLDVLASCRLYVGRAAAQVLCR